MQIFNKSLLAKFAWAMDVDPSFRFWHFGGVLTQKPELPPSLAFSLSISFLLPLKVHNFLFYFYIQQKFHAVLSILIELWASCLFHICSLNLWNVVRTCHKNVQQYNFSEYVLLADYNIALTLVCCAFRFVIYACWFIIFTNEPLIQFNNLTWKIKCMLLSQFDIEVWTFFLININFSP